MCQKKPSLSTLQPHARLASADFMLIFVFVIILLTKHNSFFMNKGELVSKMANDAKISKAQAESALNSYMKSTEDTLKKGGKITLVGFGTYSVSKRAARNGRNPQTGKPIKISARNVVKFKAGKQLSGKVNKK